MTREDFGPLMNIARQFSQAVAVSCVLSMASVAMAAPTIELFSETSNAGIPLEGADVKLPKMLDLGNAVERDRMLATDLADLPLPTNKLEELCATVPPQGSLGTESADGLHSPGSALPSWMEPASSTADGPPPAAHVSQRERTASHAQGALESSVWNAGRYR